MPPLLQERLERRKVHEQLQVLRGNIRVCCRVRPSLRQVARGHGGAGRSALLQPWVVREVPIPASNCKLARLHA